jgi:hypothetical protein
MSHHRPEEDVLLIGSTRHRFTRVVLLSGFLTFAGAASALAQVTPAAGDTPLDDTQSIKIGVTLFTDYTFTKQPKSTDADGNLFSPSVFNVARSYINVTGTVSHLVAFRFTPDVSRETGAGSSLNGSLTFRVKYAFMQVNLDDWMPKGSWARLGIQQTPLLDFEEGIYRYRFQGKVFAEREGLLTSSDAGASFHANFAQNYGDVHVGIYNGEGYSHVEVNTQKAIQIRGTIRPFAKGAMVARGLRISQFYDADNYVKSDQRRRVQTMVTFEHARANAGFDFVTVRDQTTTTATRVDAKGWSFWATPFFKEKGNGWEGLLRHDHYVPNTSAATSTQARQRTIAGLAYWFPHPGGAATAALLFDYEQVVFANFAASAATATQQCLAVHALFNF